MVGIIRAGLYTLALLWTLLITALIGNVIASNVNAASSATKAVNFTMFVAAWSWITSLYGLATAIFAGLLVPLVVVPLEIFAVLFTFIDAILLAAKLHAPNCGNIHNESHNWIAFGSHNNEKRCREIQASTAFMWFLWATFSVALFFTIKEARGGLGRLRGVRPSMSQVGA